MKYVYSSKAKKVLAVESGSALEKQAIARGLTLFDSYEEAEGAVQQANAPASGPEGYVIDKAGKVKRIAGELYNKAVARGVIIYDDLATAQAAAAPAADSSDAKETERASQPISGLRENALAYLDRLYEGDLGRDMARIAAGEKMAEGTTDAQKRFITMARAVSAARTDDEVREAMSSVPEIAARRELDFKQKNWHRGGAEGPPGKAIIAPNLTYRTQRGSGAVSKGLGVAEDLFSIVPRVLRAGAEELTSSSDDKTFAERMAVPHELLSAPQAMFTEGLSSIAPGIATERAGVAIGNAVANVIPYANRARAFLHGKQGLIAESVTDAVRNLDLPEKISRGAYAGRQTLKGLGEGAAYSAHPVALELTSPDEGSTARAALTGALGLGSGAAARAGLGALTYGSKVRSLSPEILTPAGREMRYGNGPMERIGAAISADERLLDRHGVPKALSRGSESQLAPLDQAVRDISSARTELEDRAADIFLKYGDRLPEGFKDQQLTPDMAHRLGYDIEKFGLPEELLVAAKRPAAEYTAKVKPGELPEEAFAFPGVANQYPKAEDLPMIPFNQVVRYHAPSKKSAAEIVASHGFDEKNAEDYLKVAQALTHYGIADVKFPSDEFSRVSAMLQELPRSGKEEAYLRNIGRSRLERSTGIEPFRNALGLQSKVNKELGQEYSWDIPAVVTAYRQRLTPKAALDLNSVDMNAVLPFSAAATLAGGKKAAGLAGSAGRGVVAYSPAAGARQETRYGKASANVPTLKIIGKGGIVEDPFVVKKKWKSVDDMD